MSNNKFSNIKLGVISALVAFIALNLFNSCKRGVVYDHYEHVSEQGWEKSEIFSFDINPLAEKGAYAPELQLRINNTYPFMAVNMVVETTVLPSGKKFTQYLDCKLTNPRGQQQGNGISSFQYAYPLNTLYLNKGDSLHVSIRHDMMRTPLPGITDVGFMLSNKADE